MSSFAEAVDLKKVPLRPTYGKPKSVTIIVINVSIVSEEGVQHPCPQKTRQKISHWKGKC